MCLKYHQFLLQAVSFCSVVEEMYVASMPHLQLEENSVSWLEYCELFWAHNLSCLWQSSRNTDKWCGWHLVPAPWRLEEPKSDPKTYGTAPRQGRFYCKNVARVHKSTVSFCPIICWNRSIWGLNPTYSHWRDHFHFSQLVWVPFLMLMHRQCPTHSHPNLV